MSGLQTEYGKAFEYACMSSIFSHLLSIVETNTGLTTRHSRSNKFLELGSSFVKIEMTPQFETAFDFFKAVPEELKTNLTNAANAATRVIIRLEPQLEYIDNTNPLYLSLQSDAQGQIGDVRDVLCVRNNNDWEIGLSCKHNHHAVKHSRLSSTIDFGNDWFGIPCSKKYFSSVIPLFDELQSLRSTSNKTALWSEILQKDERFYIPVLCAFMDELVRIDRLNPNIIPERLIRYLIGRHDFYKVITDDSHRTARIEAINLYGTLNRPNATKRSIVTVSKLRFPTRFYNIGFKKNSRTTIEVVCDEGWAVSMRIHNASSRVEPSLKFDVNLISLPNTVHSQVEPW